MVNARIKQRFDSLSNWVANDIVLLSGELAIVDCGSLIRFKVGDGTHSFTQLQFVDLLLLSTNSMSQGVHVSSSPYGLAAGAYLSANANFSQALGYGVLTLSSHDYSFAWNGDSTRAIGDYYESHGSGTFNINPANGLSGVFIGELTLADVIDSRQVTLSGGLTLTISVEVSANTICASIKENSITPACISASAEWILDCNHY